MPFNGTGTYSGPASSWNPAVANTDIDATDWAALLADISTALSLCITKDGQQTTTGTIPFATAVTMASTLVGSLTTDSTSSTTGAWKTAGGIGVAKALNVGTTLGVVGLSTLAGGAKTASGVTASTATGTPVTLVNLAGLAAGVHLIMAYLPGAGTQYQAASIFTHDGSNAVQKVTWDGANMTINSTGQATQSSGVNQVISYKYFSVIG